MRVMVLGAAGAAGYNYISCLRTAFGRDVYIIAVDENADQLKSLGFVADAVFHAEHKLNRTAVEKLAEIFTVDFVHAQPDNLVHLLLDADVPQTRKSELQYVNFTIKTFYTEASPLKKATVERMLAESDDGYVWVRAAMGAGSRAALKACSWDQIKAWMKVWDYISAPEMYVWEYLPGEDIALQTFYNNGELVHAGARRRLQYAGANQNINGTTSSASVAESIDTPEEALEIIDALQFRDEFHGVYCWDFKRNQDGALVMTECNYGRYFTTVNFMAELGMNTPAAELELFTSGTCDKILTVPAGYKWVRQMDRPPYLDLGVVSG